MKILFVSLGCDKNLVDSEVMLGLLRERQYEITDDEQEADVIVVNTCCFIGDAKEESINTILEMAELKKTAKLKVLIVTGCLAQRYQQDIRKEIPEVDAVLGTNSYDKICEAVAEALQGHALEYYKELQQFPEVSAKRVNTTGGYFSYLKIAEGCDKRCTYCIIPSIRGNYRSVPMERLLEEAQQLAKQGIVELILVAQETTVYGTDLYGKKMLPTLLHKLCEIPGLKWIRLLYCYPEEITDELIQTMKEEEKICNYIDMPIQHGADEILRYMGRRTNQKEIVSIVEKLRQEIPDICIRTTMITGFPGETEAEHEEAVAFVEKMKFDRLGVFTYSPEEDTPAATFDGQIDEEIKVSRRDQIMQVQQKIAFAAAEEMLYKKLTVLIEGKLPEENVFIGRTYRDAPNVDGYIFVHSNHELMSGEMVQVQVTDAKEYDLIGQVVWE